MKKMLAVFLILALVLMVDSAFSQALTYNQAYRVYYKSGYLHTTANDTTGWHPITSGGSNRRNSAFEVAWFTRADDSLQWHIYYQLKNADVGYTKAWALIDSAITVDDASATLDTTVASSTVLPTATLKGATHIRFYFDYNAGTVGTSTSAAGDGNTNEVRFYLFIKPQGIAVGF